MESFPTGARRIPGNLRCDVVLINEDKILGAGGYKTRRRSPGIGDSHEGSGA